MSDLRRISFALLGALGVATSGCDESNAVLGTKNTKDSGASDDVVTSRDAAGLHSAPSDAGDSGHQNDAVHDAAQRTTPDMDAARNPGHTLPLDGGMLAGPTAEVSQSPDVAQPPEVTSDDSDVGPTSNDGSSSESSDAAAALAPTLDGQALRDASSSGDAALAEGGIIDSNSLPDLTYLKYPDGCEVSGEQPDPDWCSLQLECPDMALVTDCRTDSFSWDCYTDYYFDENWSLGFPDDFRLLRVPLETRSGDACSLSTALSANYFSSSPELATSCASETANRDGTCVRDTGCWYTLPGSELSVWEITQPGTHCTHWEEDPSASEPGTWTCVYSDASGEWWLELLGESDLLACERSLELFTETLPDAEPACEITQWSASETSCDLYLECDVFGTAGEEAVDLLLEPYFACTRDSENVSCACGAAVLTRHVGDASPVDGWCSDISSQCEAALESELLAPAP